MAYRRKKKSCLGRLVGLICCIIVGYIVVDFVYGKFFMKQADSTSTTEIAVNTKNNATYTNTQMVQVDKADEASELKEINIYSEANTYSTVIDTAFVGEWLEYLEESNGMTMVKSINGYEGYVANEFVQESKTVALRDAGSLDGYTILLDPGHGGNDSGSLDNSQLYYEKDFTLAAAEAIKEKLEAAGVTVYMTRSRDETLELEERVAISVEKEPDLFISIHFDSNDWSNSLSGFTTYYYYPRDEALATAINTQIDTQVTLDNIGVRQENHMVTRETPYPALLLELGFMNSDYDVSVVQTDSYFEEVTQGILAGLSQYYDVN